MATVYPSDPHSTDNPLIRWFQGASAAERGMLVDVYGRFVLRVARRFGLRSTDAFDVAQDVFLHLICRDKITRYSFGHPNGGFRKWLRIVVIRKAHDYRRKFKRPEMTFGTSDTYRALSNVAAVDDVSGSVVFSEEMQDIFRQVQTEFEPKTWNAFWRFKVDGIRSDEVADELDMKRGAVYVACSRVCKRLREEWGRRYGDIGEI